MDRAYAGKCRAGYVRAGVYIPIFDNEVLPAVKNAKAPSFTDVKRDFLNIKTPTFTSLKKPVLNAKAPSFTDIKKRVINIKAPSFTDVKEAVKKHG
jgi:hypothetical protein